MAVAARSAAVLFVAAAIVASALPALAANNAASRTAAATASELSSKERNDIGRRLVTRWGVYVERIYGIDSDVWARRMQPNLAVADGYNLRAAAGRDTFEGAMAALAGQGGVQDDEDVIGHLAAGNNAKAFGGLDTDLVYNPITPCRIVDTRSRATGPIPAGETHSFLATNAENFTSQGGSTTNCGTFGLTATAVAVNVTAVTPAGAGFATAFPYGTPLPGAASVNYVAGAIVNNALIVQIPNPVDTHDISIYSFAESHYVVDIVGYFAPPQATALECVDTAQTITEATPWGVTTSTAPACPAGYTETATQCSTSIMFMNLLSHGNGTCVAYMNSGVMASLRSSRKCCRVPGR